MSAADGDLAERFRQRLDGLLGTSDQPSPRLGIAVSGGGDSMALLDLAAACRPVEVASVNHGLRPAAADEVALVAQVCHARAIPHETLHWAGKDATGNLMGAARVARYQLLADWAKRRGLTHVALGHTEDDVAETFLMRLGRRAGLDGLAAMRPVWRKHGVTWIRPLLGFGRDDLRDYLRARDLSWFDDPTNEDMAYDRARIRQALALLAPLGLTREAIATSASNLAASRDYQARQVHALARSCLRDDQGADRLVLDASHLFNSDPELQRLLLAAALHYLSGQDYPPRGRALERLRAALESGGNGELANCRVEQTAGVMTISRTIVMKGSNPPNFAKDFLTFLVAH